MILNPGWSGRSNWIVLLLGSKSITITAHIHRYWRGGREVLSIAGAAVTRLLSGNLKSGRLKSLSRQRAASTAFTELEDRSAAPI